jgi:preprotein translocase subunit SecG
MGIVYGLLLTILVIVAFLLIAVVLLQSGKGGGMAASFGGAGSSSDAVFGTRQAGNILTKASWWLGGIFLGLSFVLQIASTRRTAPKSVLDQTFGGRPAATAPATATPTTGAPTAPALPLEQPGATTTAPATSTPAPQR